MLRTMPYVYCQKLTFTSSRLPLKAENGLRMIYPMMGIWPCAATRSHTSITLFDTVHLLVCIDPPALRYIRRCTRPRVLQSTSSLITFTLIFAFSHHRDNSHARHRPHRPFTRTLRRRRRLPSLIRVQVREAMSSKSEYGAIFRSCPSSCYRSSEYESRLSIGYKHS